MSICRRRSPWPDATGAVLALAAIFASPASSAADDAAELARLRDEIRGIVGSQSDCYNVVHCLVLSMGYDACGQPTHHVGFSNRTGIKGQLEAKAAEYTFIEEEMQRGKPRPASCTPAVIPKPVCHRNHCTAGAAGE